MFAHFSRVLAVASFTMAAGAALASGSAHAASLVAGMDTSGVSSSPARSVDPFTDGARNGPRNPYVDGARVGKRNPFVDGARIGGHDVFSDGAHNGPRDTFSAGA
ncbi:hypothetical protein D9M68_385970 [compost metagenome]